MPEIVFESPDDLYSKIDSKISLIPGGWPSLTLDEHSSNLLDFYHSMRVIKDPNSCSCKKTAEAKRRVNEIYLSIPIRIMHDKNRSNLLAKLFEESTLVFMYEGKELARV